MRIDITNWILKITIPVLLILTFSNCRFHSNPLAEFFIKDDSISNRARFAFYEVSTFYSEITKKAGKDSDTARKAYTVYHAVQNFVSLMDKTIVLLEEKDPSGYDTLAFKRLLYNTPLGDSILASVANVSRTCDAVFDRQDKIQASDGLVATAKTVLQNPGVDQWNNPPHKTTSTVTSLEVLKLTGTMIAADALFHIIYSLDPASIPGGTGGK